MRILNWVLVVLLLPAANPASPDVEMAEGAVSVSLKWLARHQHADGSWSVSGYTRECGGKKTNKPEKYFGTCDDIKGEAKGDVATTSLGVLSFLGAGYFHKSKNTYDGVQYGEVVRTSLQWLMDRQDKNGLIGKKEGDWIAAHALATLALCEAYCLTESDWFEESAQKAVDKLVSLQGKDGSWGEHVEWMKDGPRASGVGSVLTTGFALMAVKSAKLAGLKANDKAVYKKADGYLESMVRKDGLVKSLSGKPTYKLAPVYLVSKLIMKDRSERSEPVRSTIRDHLPGMEEFDPVYVWLGTLAMFLYDGPTGMEWRRWCQPLKKTLLEASDAMRDDKRGSWDPPKEITGGLRGRVAVTAMNGLSLEIYYRYTSVFGSKERDNLNPPD